MTALPPIVAPQACPLSITMSPDSRDLEDPFDEPQGRAQVGSTDPQVRWLRPERLLPAFDLTDNPRPNQAFKQAFNQESYQESNQESNPTLASLSQPSLPAGSPSQDREPALHWGDNPQTRACFIISEVKDVPHGEYLSMQGQGLASVFKEHFAVIKTLEHAATVLVDEVQWGSHAQFELRRRLLALGLVDLRVSVASQEIIKSVHNAHEGGEALQETQVETKAWAIINSAIAKHASDIHMETRGAFAQVYFRIFGERQEQPSVSAKSAMEMCNVLYGVHADADNKGITWDEKTVKDAVIEHRTVEGKHVQLRLSSAPIHPSGNFHVVIRLLVMDTQTLRPIESMGYTPAQVAAIEDMLIAAHGAVLLVGPTNSGKSTSLQSLIARIIEHRGRHIKVITVEKPVEYLIHGACQMGVPEARRDLMNRQNGSIFTTFVAATLRQDPDVVMVGEVNDVDSADNIKQLVLSGRKTLSTLHVSEAMSVFTRLRELGVPSSVLLMKGFISGVVFQRLVPLLCPHCSVPVMSAFHRGEVRLGTMERLRACADLTLEPVRVRGAGCEACDHLSIVGRTVCAEVLVPDDIFLEHLANDRMRQARAHWRRQSRCAIEGLGCTALSHAIAKMRLGLIDPRDIERWMGPLLLEEAVEDTLVEPSSPHGVRDLGARVCEEGRAPTLPVALNGSPPKPSKKSTLLSTTRPSSSQASRPSSRQAQRPSKNVSAPTATPPA